VVSLFDPAKMAAMVLEHINVEDIAKEVMRKLVMENLRIFLIVRNFPDSECYDFEGMAYDRAAAKKLAAEISKVSNFECKVLELDMGKLAFLAERIRAAEEVT